MQQQQQQIEMCTRLRWVFFVVVDVASRLAEYILLVRAPCGSGNDEMPTINCNRTQFFCFSFTFSFILVVFQFDAKNLNK